MSEFPMLSLNTDALKRPNSPNAEQSKQKRQFVGAFYDDIVASVIRSFGPIIWTCSDESTHKYEYDFVGKNRIGNVDSLKLVLRCKLEAPTLTRPRRSFLISFGVRDSFGGNPDVWMQLSALGILPMHRILCGQTASEVVSELSAVILPWLEFANDRFTT